MTRKEPRDNYAEKYGPRARSPSARRTKCAAVPVRPIMYQVYKGCADLGRFIAAIVIQVSRCKHMRVYWIRVASSYSARPLVSVIARYVARHRTSGRVCQNDVVTLLVSSIKKSDAKCELAHKFPPDGRCKERKSVAEPN